MRRIALDKNAIAKKVGQLMVFGFQGKQATPEIKQLIRDHHLGAIILFGRNIGTPQEVLELTTELQREAKAAGHAHPLLICTDQENGAVRRLGEGATIFPGAMLLGATHSSDNAYKIGVGTGKELKAIGINWNLSPVLDVNNNAQNPVIGVRSFGESAERVSEFGSRIMKGMQGAGMITTLKHFPGHGDTHVDSHHDLPIISHEMERLDEIELKPFRACIENGADTVMSAHVYFPAIENKAGVPATLSKKVMTGLLRERLNFDGVVITDCMEMKAIANRFGTDRGAVEALKAGVDLILVSHTYKSQMKTIDTVMKAIESGEIDEETLAAASKRISKLKETYLKWEDIQLEGEVVVPTVVGCEQHSKEAEDVFRQGITIVRNDDKLLPLSNSDDHRVLVVYPENSYAVLVEDKRYSTFTLGESIQNIHPGADIAELSNPPTEEEIHAIALKAKEFDTIIVATLTVTPGDSQITLVEKLHEMSKRVVVVATRSPYDFAYLPHVPAYICTYEFTTPALSMATRAIYGKETVRGKLPITISSE